MTSDSLIVQQDISTGRIYTEISIGICYFSTLIEQAIKSPTHEDMHAPHLLEPCIARIRNLLIAATSKTIVIH